MDAASTAVVSGTTSSNGNKVPCFFVLAHSEKEAKEILRKKRTKSEFTLTCIEDSRSLPTASPVIILKEMGVLGLSHGEKGSVDIPPNHIVVDPAGLPYISGTLPIKKAGALSGAIYAHYHVKGQFRPGQLLRDCAGFPYAVKKNVSAEGAAFAYQYHEGTVIHVVGPNFNEGSALTMRDAVVRLSTAYYNVIKAAESHVRDIKKANESTVYNKGAVVRMPLISMGEFAGKFTDEEKYELTAKAVTRAFSAVKTPKSTNGPDIQYWLCLYHNNNTREYKGYERALKEQTEESIQKIKN